MLLGARSIKVPTSMFSCSSPLSLQSKGGKGEELEGMGRKRETREIGSTGKQRQDRKSGKERAGKANLLLHPQFRHIFQVYREDSHSRLIVGKH